MLTHFLSIPILIQKQLSGWVAARGFGSPEIIILTEFFNFCLCLCKTRLGLVHLEVNLMLGFLFGAGRISLGLGNYEETFKVYLWTAIQSCSVRENPL